MLRCENYYSLTFGEGSTYHEGEELTILPRMLKIPDLKDFALELELEHADMKVHFEALIKEGYDHEIWLYKLAPLYDIMHAH
jgi:hypothetical protein